MGLGLPSIEHLQKGYSFYVVAFSLCMPKILNTFKIYLSSMKKDIIKPVKTITAPK